MSRSYDIDREQFNLSVYQETMAECARLRAVNAELLEALQNMLSLYNSSDLTSNTKAATKRRSMVWDAANMAITKATS